MKSGQVLAPTEDQTAQAMCESWTQLDHVRCCLLGPEQPAMDPIPNSKERLNQDVDPLEFNPAGLAFL